MRVRVIIIRNNTWELSTILLRIVGVINEASKFKRYFGVINDLLNLNDTSEL